MKLIFRHISNFIKLLVAVAVTGIIISAQAPQTRQTKWQGLIGKENEFVFLMPEGFQTSEDGEVYVGKKPNFTRVKNKRTISRHINGVVLMVDLFEGKVSEIQPALAELHGAAPIKEEAVNGFQVKTYLKKYPDFTWEQQHFYTEDSLYVMHAVYRNLRIPLVADFFKAARLINKEVVVAPNFPKNASKNSLNAALPVITEELGSEEIVEQPDKKAVVLYRPKPNFRRGFGASNSGVVKFKALLSPSGKVLKIERISSPNITLADGVRASVEHMVYLPAEKDGKRVAAWETVEYGFQMSLSGSF